VADGRLINSTIQKFKSAGARVHQRFKDEKGTYAFGCQVPLAYTDDSTKMYVGAGRVRFDGNDFFHKTLVERADKNDALLCFRLCPRSGDDELTVYRPDTVLAHDDDRTAQANRDALNIPPEAGVSLEALVEGWDEPDTPEEWNETEQSGLDSFD
jgi:hypothetical protein